jgi:hypothetical protein
MVGSDLSRAADATSQNVSVGSIGLLSPVDYPPGAHVELVLGSTPDGVSISVEGQVRRSRPTLNGHGFVVGIEFTDLDWTTRAHILSLAPSQPWGVEGLQNRQFVRGRGGLPVRYKTGLLGRWRETTSVDLGVGGLMFAARKPPKPGRKLRVQINLTPGLEDPTMLDLCGLVVDVNPADDSALVSVTFVAPPAEARKQLAARVVGLLDQGDA